MVVNPAHVNPLDCDAVSESCPVQASIYGYYPSIGWNAFFAAVFGICFFVNFWLGLRFRTWTYMAAMCCACIASTIGYAGRVTMHDNPFAKLGFQMQICALTMSPAWNAAALYLILKHLVLLFGRECSRIRPKYYTWGFIFVDFLALSLQAAGGGIAGSAGDNASFRDVGDRLMITGISWQVLTLLMFAGVAADYFLRLSKSSQPLPKEAQACLQDRRFRIFVVSLAFIYITIFIRCVYRIAEMAGGWRNPIMQDQALFIGVDSWMIGIATVLQTVVHPGIFFPFLCRSSKLRKSKNHSEIASGEAASEDSVEKSAV
ncbi:hypothetical protein LTR84_012296 [Exophiala bonariae]|uniref:Uncharacterized protein n=1 Tax=Exophiala bonariae TaxID=1690606 RepID=A0AAV9NGW1_9EURO|nr:hypothetical protein LTR84_012296 [Exophiala bonariae]